MFPRDNSDRAIADLEFAIGCKREASARAMQDFMKVQRELNELELRLEAVRRSRVFQLEMVLPRHVS